MRKALLVSCLLQAAVATAANAAGPFGTIQVGTWKGGAFSDNNTGEFSHCAATSTYGSGISLVVGQNAAGSWLLSFASPNFRLNKGSTVPLDVVFDARSRRSCLPPPPTTTWRLRSCRRISRAASRRQA
jgi:hypothetical protein